jgi:lipopolysaccharide export system protein LptA
MAFTMRQQQPNAHKSAINLNKFSKGNAMKRFSFLSLFILSLAVFACAHAEKADSTKPAEIDADSMVYDNVQQVSTYTGKPVLLTRGTLIMKANKVVAKRDPAGYQYATLLSGPGGFASFRQKRDGGDLWIEGQAERIEYDDKTEMVKLFTKAKLKRLDGIKVTDEMDGEFISYDIRTDFFTVNNTATGTGKQSTGRIKVVIQPRTETPNK